MGDWLQRQLGRLLGKAVVGVLGFAGWFVYVSFFGGGYEVTEVSEVPSVVFGGGGGTLEIEVEMSRSGEMTAYFERYDESDEAAIDAVQKLESGDHVFLVDLPDATYGYLDVNLPDAAPGDRLAWTVHLDGQQLAHEEQVYEDGIDLLYVQLEFEELAELRRFAQR